MLEAKRFDNSVTRLVGYANFFAVITLDLGHVVIQVASRREIYYNESYLSDLPLTFSTG